MQVNMIKHFFQFLNIPTKNKQKTPKTPPKAKKQKQKQLNM